MSDQNQNQGTLPFVLPLPPLPLPPLPLSLEHAAPSELEALTVPVASVEPADGIYPDGWFQAAPFPDRVTHWCFGQFGGIRGHVHQNVVDQSYTAFHGVLQLGITKDLAKAKAAVETGKRMRNRAPNKKEAASEPQGASTATASAAQLTGPPVPALPVSSLAAGDTSVAAAPAVSLAPGELSVPALPGFSGPGSGAERTGDVIGNLFQTLMPPTMCEVTNVGPTPLPAIPTESAPVAKPKNDGIALAELRGFMDQGWCDSLESLVVEGFQLKDAELTQKVGMKGSGHRDIPKYYDGPRTPGVEPMVKDMMVQAGIDKLVVDGGHFVQIRESKSGDTVNIERLLKLGVPMAIIEAATEKGKPYTYLTFVQNRRRAAEVEGE